MMYTDFIYSSYFDKNNDSSWLFVNHIILNSAHTMDIDTKAWPDGRSQLESQTFSLQKTEEVGNVL